MPLTADRDIARVLATARTIALVGASNDPGRPSYQVMKYLLGEGYEVFPVNPGLAAERLLDCGVYSALGEIPVAIDMVVVFRQPRFLLEIVREAMALDVRTVWAQLGVVDHAAARLAVRGGVDVVMDRCAAIERPRLRRMGLL